MKTFWNTPIESLQFFSVSTPLCLKGSFFRNTFQSHAVWGPYTGVILCNRNLKIYNGVASACCYLRLSKFATSLSCAGPIRPVADRHLPVSSAPATQSNPTSMKSFFPDRVSPSLGLRPPTAQSKWSTTLQHRTSKDDWAQSLSNFTALSRHHHPWKLFNQILSANHERLMDTMLLATQ